MAKALKLGTNFLTYIYVVVCIKKPQKLCSVNPVLDLMWNVIIINITDSVIIMEQKSCEIIKNMSIIL